MMRKIFVLILSFSFVGCSTTVLVGAAGGTAGYKIYKDNKAIESKNKKKDPLENAKMKDGYVEVMAKYLSSGGKKSESFKSRCRGCSL